VKGPFRCPAVRITCIEANYLNGLVQHSALFFTSKRSARTPTICLSANALPATEQPPSGTILTLHSRKPRHTENPWRVCNLRQTSIL
jgi:hypothetical protein